VPSLFAQDRLLPVFHFRQVRNLPTKYVNSRTVRDEEGFVWIGTVDGLARYDGYSVREYRNAPDDPHSLPASQISGLFVDSRKWLWVKSSCAGISLYDRQRNCFINMKPRVSDGSLPQADVRIHIMEDHHGNLWLDSKFAGVTRIEIPPGSGSDGLDSLCSRVSFRTFSLRTRHNSANDLVEGADGRILIASDSGLIILNSVTNAVMRPGFASSPGCLLDSVTVQCLYTDSSNILWVGTGTEGLFRIDWGRRTVTNFRHAKRDVNSIASDNILDIAPEQGGNLWLGTNAGLQLFSPTSGEQVRFLTDGPAPVSPSVYINLSIDRFGTLWIGTAQEGVFWLSPESRLFPHFALCDSNGSSPRPVSSINRDEDGKFWFASKGMITQIDVPSGKVLRTIDVFQGKKPTYGNYRSFIDRRGTYWYGTWGLGLFQVDLTTGRIRNFGTTRELGIGRIANRISQASRDTLFVAAHRNGLKRFDPVSGRFTEVQAFSNMVVTSALQDRMGLVWVSSITDGITILNPATGATETLRNNPSDSHSLSSDQAYLVFEDSQRRLWFSVGNTIDRWDPERRTIQRYPNPVFNKANMARPLLSNATGQLWIGFWNGGLSLLDPSTGDYTNFDGSDGAARGLTCMVSLEDGRLVAGGWDGLNIFHPDSIKRRRRSPPLVLTAMGINDKPVPAPCPAKLPGPMILPFSENVLEFEFAVIDIDEPDFIRYQYRLEGLETDWVESPTWRHVRYPGLAPGDYVFRVRASSLKKEWADQELSIGISIAPSWWQTWWFRILAGSALLGFIGFVYWREASRYKKERHVQQEFSQKLIETQESGRKRLAAELHDGLGQDLLVANNELQQFLQDDPGSVEDVKRAASLVQESIQNVREIASELHPHYLDRLGLCAAVEVMTENITHSSGLSIDCQCDKVDGLLSKETEIHLFRIIQEALSNVVRHAEATKVTLQIKDSSAGIELTITDDGKGFTVEFGTTRASFSRHDKDVNGFGLSSMAERARIIGGTLNIRSSPGSGTTIHLTAPHS
jgi:signal transduction histidine kinase/ligand-binding sensor domain-containing protein